jgi:hypothetical protein
METPTYDSVLLDLEIDPADHMGHDARVNKIINANRSKILPDLIDA